MACISRIKHVFYSLKQYCAIITYLKLYFKFFFVTEKYKSNKTKAHIKMGMAKKQHILQTISVVSMTTDMKSLPLDHHIITYI